MTIKKLFATIEKSEDLEDGTIKVYGYASTETVDSDGETITADAMKAALPDYMRWGAVREMHQPKAAGTAIEAKVEDDGRTWFGAHVVDSEAVKKVKTGVYKGFSVGGRVTARDRDDKNIIKGIRLVEVSLVDRPANPEATIELWKGEGVEPPADATPEAAVDALADLLNKGAITPERLVELAQDEIAKASTPPAQPSAPTDGADSSTAAPGSAEGQSAAGTALAKGLSSVATLAQLLQSVGWLAVDTAWEAQYEGDNSPVPAALRDWVAQGAGILQAMTAEEVGELLAGVTSAVAANEIARGAQASDLAKAGARFSAATKAALGDIHKALADCCTKMDGLGYKTADDDDGDGGDGGDDDVSSADTRGDLAKAQADLKDAADALAKAQAERDDLVKQLADLKARPAPGKALLKALSKDDEPTLKTASNDLPPLPENATQEERALHEIKKAFRAGPIPIHQFQQSPPAGRIG